MIKYVFIAFFVSVSVSAQSKPNWNKLIKSAHNIGFCLYNTNQVFCELHKTKHQELEAEYNNEDKEFFYATMKEDWAKKRVSDLAKKQSVAKESFVLFFDINQGFEINYGNIKRPRFGFFVINTNDDLKFEALKTYKNEVMNCMVFHKNKPNILANAFWREFMSGRLGLIENKVEFLVYNKNNIQKKFNKFKNKFYKFQKHNRIQN